MVLAYNQSRQPEEAKDNELVFTLKAKSETLSFLAGLIVYRVVGSYHSENKLPDTLSAHPLHVFPITSFEFCFIDTNSILRIA